MEKKSLVHSVLFKKGTKKKFIKKFLEDNNLDPIKPVHITKNYYRFRIVDPDKFKSFYSKGIGKKIVLVFGVLK